MKAIKIRFNPEIYPKSVLRRAMQGYSKFAGMAIRKKEKYLVVDIKCSDSELRPIIAEEFSNYALGLIKKCL